jgi:polyprenyl-phospho-N-acetylgalactosaminyl synthase
MRNRDGYDGMTDSVQDFSKIWVVIAAFNEGEVISDTVMTLRAVIQNIVVVDDCSTDQTKFVLLQLPVHLVCHPINLGQGAALQTGIDYAIAKGAEYVATFDADGQHDASDLPLMASRLIDSQASIALGSRFLGKTINLPKSRRVMLKAAVIYTRLTCGLKVSDAHNGFRLMTREFCQAFRFTQNRMAHASEILSFIAAKHTKYIEVPVTIAYTEYSIKKGQRNVNALRVITELIGGFISK